MADDWDVTRVGCLVFYKVDEKVFLLVVDLVAYWDTLSVAW